MENIKEKIDMWDNKEYPIKGIDISHWQGDIDFQKVKEIGIKFVYIKATEGSTWVDPKIKHNIEECKKNGLYYGVYHLFRETSSGEEQLAHFIKQFGQANLIPMVDLEHRVVDQAKNVKELKKELIYFLLKSEYRLILYTSYRALRIFARKMDWITQSLIDTLQSFIHSFWWCDYSYGVGKPTNVEETNWSLWQITSDFKIGNKFFDLNYFRGENLSQIMHKPKEDVYCSSCMGIDGRLYEYE